MDSIDVYSQYFEAEMEVDEYMRHGALVKLIVTSGEGMIKYEAAVSMIFYEDPEDFRVPYDKYYSEVIYDGPGIRSKPREAKMIVKLREIIDRLIAPDGGVIFWDKPITEPRLG